MKRYFALIVLSLSIGMLYALSFFLIREKTGKENAYSQYLDKTIVKVNGYKKQLINMFVKKIFVICAMILCHCNANSQNFEQVLRNAKNGDAKSQYHVGYSYALGYDGLSVDYQEAFSWLKKSALNGCADAAYYIGILYYRGDLEGGNSKAHYWFSVSDKLGYPLAKHMMECCKGMHSLPKVIVHEDFDPRNPPILELITNSVEFVDPNGNNTIDAGEKCFIKFQVVNKGKGIARDCIANILSADVNNGLQLDTRHLADIAPGEKVSVSLAVNANYKLATGKIDLVVQVNEPHGLGTDPIQLSVNTKQFTAPKLRVVDYAITSANGNKLLRKTPFDMQVLLQNLEHGMAENVNVELVVPDGVLIMSDGGNIRKFSKIEGGETKSLDYSLIVSDIFKGAVIPIDVKIHEKYGKYSQDMHYDLKLNQVLTSNKIKVQEKENKSRSFVIETASLTSDVDKNIPECKSTDSDNTFAVVIANESYNKEAGVPFAANDGRIFSEYCRKTIGIPETNVRLLTNATLNDMKHEIGWLRQVMDSRKGKAKVIFYYAGHGIPDEKDHQAYLLPVDGYGSDISTGYSLNRLYQELGGIPSKSVVILLDACFSGAKRDGDMLASARGIALKVKRGEPQGNMVVISAAQGDETAFPYKKEGHGLFTYFLLKKMQESQGDVTLQELSDYLLEKVSQQSIVVNSKSQTPTVIVSNSIAGDWSKWKLK